MTLAFFASGGHEQARTFDACCNSRFGWKRCALLAKPQRPYEVFISFGEPDAETAHKVFTYLRNRIGCSVFFAPAVLPEQKRFWSEPIDTALMSANAFFAIANAPKNLARGWVKYEVRAFHQLHGADEDSTIIPFISGFEHCLLPMPLRAHQALSWKDGSTFDEALRQGWALPYDATYHTKPAYDSTLKALQAP